MSPPFICVVGTSGSGKTTLVVRLVPALIRLGLRVGTIKHDAHGVDLDRKGKDSWRHKEAGAHTTVVASRTRVGVVRDLETELDVPALVEAYLGHVDLVVVEGYKGGPWPKIEVHRVALGRPLVSSPDTGLLAVASDEPLDVGVPCLDLDDAEALAAFVVARVMGSSPAGTSRS